MDKLVLSAFQKIKEAFIPSKNNEDKTPPADPAETQAVPTIQTLTIKDEYQSSTPNTDSKKPEADTKEENKSGDFYSSILSGINSVGKFIANPIASISEYISSNITSSPSNDKKSPSIFDRITEGISSAWNSVTSLVSPLLTGGSVAQKTSAYNIDNEIERQRKEEERLIACQEREYRSSPAVEPSTNKDSPDTQTNQNSDEAKKAVASSALMKYLITKYGHVLQGFDVGPLTTENQLINFLIRSKRLSSDELISILEKKGLSFSGVFDTLQKKGLDHKFSEAATLGLASGSANSAINFVTELGKSHKALRSEPSTGNALRFSA